MPAIQHNKPWAHPLQCKPQHKAQGLVPPRHPVGSAAGQSATHRTAPADQHAGPSQLRSRTQRSRASRSSRQHHPGADRSQEVGPSEPLLPQVTENEVGEIPESIPASQDTVIFSPSGRPMLDRDEPSPVETPPNPKRKLMRQHAANIRRGSVNSGDRGIGLHTSPSKEVAASHTHRQTNTGSETGRRDLQHPRAALGMVYR